MGGIAEMIRQAAEQTQGGGAAVAVAPAAVAPAAAWAGSRT